MNPGRWSRTWLLWLALLLPLAQALAGAHALSHVTSDRTSDGIVHLAQCDLCLTAADLGSGAPVAEAPRVMLADAAYAAPVLARGGAPRAVSLGLPPARAPPASA
ncbi:hypothetical protein [Roseateles sp. BYS87W]|uniref:DUF2946 domain-containing protein n=1 Tax=Pelomonas baiyunensis TaxID=3299026 RepID=A0ABW7GT80_9BURK